MTVSYVNNVLFSALSNVNVVNVSSLAAVNGQTIVAGYASVAPYRYTAYQVGGISDGTPLTTWANQGTGGSNDATTAGAAPVYRATLGPGGKPTIQFNGTSQALGLASGLTSQPMTILAVVKLSDTANRSIVAGTTSGAGSCLQYRVSNQKQEALCMNVASLATSTSDLSTSDFEQVGMDYSNATHIAHFWLASVADGTTTGITDRSLPQQVNRIGLKGDTADEFWSDFISEIRIYTSILSGSDLTNEQADLLSIWGV